jgi:translation initiation factor IF-1
MAKPDNVPAYIYEYQSKSKIPPISVERRRKKRIKFLLQVLLVLFVGAAGLIVGLVIADAPDADPRVVVITQYDGEIFNITDVVVRLEIDGAAPLAAAFSLGEGNDDKNVIVRGGVVVTKDGHIVTTCHEDLQVGETVRVKISGKERSAVVEAVEGDLVLLKVVPSPEKLNEKFKVARFISPDVQTPDMLLLMNNENDEPQIVTVLDRAESNFVKFKTLQPACALTGYGLFSLDGRAFVGLITTNNKGCDNSYEAVFIPASVIESMIEKALNT